ncbi:MAG: phage holin family protein [Patescibacteria group bacterium]|nr:phage holin family protein [Patescibacteria group bacterium]
MSFLTRLIVLFVSNIVALFAAAYFVVGFSINPGWESYAKVALILTVINIFIRPLLKAIFSPVIFITLGLGVILVNALILYVVDYFSPDLVIAGLYPLVYATLIISAVNAVLSIVSKKVRENENA